MTLPVDLESEEYKYFCKLTLRGKLLKDCELVYKGKHDNIRLYVLKEKNFFAAHAIEFVSCPAEGAKNRWENEALVVQTIFEVTAYFDGIRHLEFNRNGGEMDGYLYYPNMVDLIAMLQKIREIELEHCRSAEQVT